MTDTDIVVVGAGPVGLTAALAVRATGRPVTVLEAGAADRIRPGSRAIFIHKESLVVLERLRPGLGWQLTERGLTWTTRRTLYRGRTVYAHTYPPPPAGVLPTMTSLPQVVTEQLLVDACHDAGVTFNWNAPVRGVTPDADYVDIVVEGGASLRARYVIAADGSRSAVRESSGVTLEGPRTTNAFVIVDITEDPDDPLPVERVFHYEHPAAGGRSVLYVPFAGHWRVDLQCLPDDDPDTFSSVDGLRSWLPKVMPARYADRVAWVSSYVFRQAVANSFVDRSGRVLLAGEAGHVFAPFGARGLNSGIPDAFVAVTAITAALGASSSTGAVAAIRAFEATRHAAALRNREASSIALRHLVAQSAGARTERWLAGHLAPFVPALGRWMDRAPYGPPLGGRDQFGMRY